MKASCSSPMLLSNRVMQMHQPSSNPSTNMVYELMRMYRDHNGPMNSSLPVLRTRLPTLGTFDTWFILRSLSKHKTYWPCESECSCRTANHTNNPYITRFCSPCISPEGRMGQFNTNRFRNVRANYQKKTAIDVSSVSGIHYTWAIQTKRPSVPDSAARCSERQRKATKIKLQHVVRIVHTVRSPRL